MIFAPMSGGTGTVRASCGGASDASSTELDSGTGLAFHWPHVSSLALAALDTAPACGRGHIRAVLREWQLGHLAEDAEILASEILTNAVKASWRSGDSICLRLLADREQLIIEAWDRNPANPQPRVADYEDDSGRGLAVIEAVANRWGHYRVHSGWKVVWAEMLIATIGTGR